MSLLAEDRIRKSAFSERVSSTSCCAFVLMFVSLSAYSEWRGEINTSIYYTDDVGLFSVTRRLSLLDDPTQPVVDRPNQGSDFVYEPNVLIAWSGQNSLAEFEIEFDAGGYVFTGHSDYTHGFYEVQLAQTFYTGTELRFAYEFVPDLFLVRMAYLAGESERENE